MATEHTVTAESVRPLAEADYRDQADFRRSIRRFLRFSEEQAVIHGITPQQHLLLLVVRGHPSYPRVTITEIADAMLLGQPGISLLVNRSVKRGLLRREEDPADRRRVMVSLTDQGQSILDAITHANRREMSKLGSSLFRDSLIAALQGYGTSESEADEEQE